MKHAAIQEIQVLESVSALHAKLHQQEQVLISFVNERDEAIAARHEQEMTLKAFREEGATLRKSIDSQKAVTVEKQALVARTKVLEEIHDVCRSLSAWKLTRMLATRVELVYEHSNGSFHVIEVQFAAKPPGIICSLKFSMKSSSNKKVSKKTTASRSEALDFFPDLVASLDPVWTRMVQNAKTLPALQRAMQTIDIEMGRMQALDADLSAAARRFVIPKGIQIRSVGEGKEKSTSICSFTANFSCLEPASKWNVGFDVRRGYPFGCVNIVPETEFGISPANVSDISDVAFGYGRIERACEYLEKVFLDQCLPLLPST